MLQLAEDFKIRYPQVGVSIEEKWVEFRDCLQKFVLSKNIPFEDTERLQNHLPQLIECTIFNDLKYNFTICLIRMN